MSFVKKLQNSAIDQAFQTVNTTLEDHEKRITENEENIKAIIEILAKNNLIPNFKREFETYQTFKKQILGEQ